MNDALLLDSNAIIALFDGSKTVAKTMASAARIVIPAVVCGEIDAGVEKLGSILNQTKAEYYRQEIVKAGGTVLYGTRVVGAIIEGEDAKGRPLVRGVKVVTADGTVDAATTNVWDKGYTSAICYGSRFSIKDEAIIALAKAKYAPFGPKLAEMMKSLPDDAPYSRRASLRAT